nr:amidohydrolase family protein [uncultured Niameybacter sp.]
MVDYIFSNGTIITMDSERRILTNSSLVVDEGKIIYIGSKEEVDKKFKANKTIDCEYKVIMPGFIDAHGHAGHTFFRFVVKDTKHWMPAMTHTYKHYTTDEFWYIEGRVSALERVKNGVTTGVSVLGSQPRCDSPVPAINNAKAYNEVGIRNVICTGPGHIPWPHNFSRYEDGKRVMKSVSFEQVVESLEEVIKQLHKTNNEKTFVSVTPFGVVTSINPSGATPKEQLTTLTEHDMNQAKAMLEIARKYNVRIHTDCFGGMLHLAKQDLSNAVLGPHVHVQHCSYLDDEEIDLLVQTGTHATMAPYSGAPVHKMLDKGVSLAATTDGAKTGDGFDMFKCMREFQKVHRRTANDNSLLPNERMLELVTIDAAKVLGLEEQIGSLEVNKKADIIAIDLLNPRLMPSFNVVHSLVLSGEGQDVSHVMVDGQLIMENKIVKTVDERDVLLEAQEEAVRTVERANLKNFAYLDEYSWGQNRKSDKELFDMEWQRRDGGHY